MTDYQIWDLVLLPAVRRSREMDRRNGDGRGVRGRANRLPTKEEYVEVGIKLGGVRELLEADYDKWAASQGAPHG